MASLGNTAEPLVRATARPSRNLDGWLLLSAAILLLIGLMSLYSIDATSTAGASRSFFKQAVRLLIGLGPFVVFYLVSPKALIRHANLLYVLNLIVLALVLVAGVRAGGAQRWISFGPIEFQPSEMAKLLTVVTLAAFYAKRQGQAPNFATFALSLVHVAVPILLIFKQPHLGASLTILVVWLGVSVAAGTSARLLVGTVVAAALLLGAAFKVPGVLQDYQKERVAAMFGGDPKGSKFQVLRAKSAFAAGGISGVGFLKGEQKRAGFVPEQHTDFIFTVIGEEGGLIGCTLVIAAYAFFFWRVWLIMVRAEDRFAKMVVAGIFSYLAFHTVVNLGMNLELLPVVGLWLPFMSYGGTAIWLCLASVGLLLNLRRLERPVLF